MRIILIALALVASALILWYCKHTRYSAANLPAKQLRFGSGGGFTGKETGYMLLENGQLFQNNPGAGPVEIQATRRKTAQAIFKTAETLGLASLDFKHPGNVYDFIEFAEGDKLNRVSWGDPHVTPDPKITDLYAQLTALTAGRK